MLVRVRNAAVPWCSCAIRNVSAKGATRREARRGLAALTITDDRRVMPARRMSWWGDVECAMTITNDR